MTRGRVVLAVVATLLLLADPAAAQTPPGTLLALTPLGSYAPAAVDRQVAGRFVNDGETPPRAATAVDAYLVRFATTGPDGGGALAMAQLFVPRTASEAALLAYAPGSTGLTARCSPANVRLATGRVETYGATALAYAGQGIATLIERV